MRFKVWLSEHDSLATSLMHGGLNQSTNANMPVNSKWVTKSAPNQNHEPERHPEQLFGFRSRNDLKQTKERRAKFIDRERRRVPTRDDRPDIIY